MNQFTQWNRLYRLLVFFNTILGRKTICKVLISGLMIPILELGGLALIFPFLKLATDTQFHTLLINHINSSSYLISLRPYFENHVWAVSFVGLGIVFIYVIRSWLTAYLLNYQLTISAYINSNTSEKLINDALRSRYQLFIEHSPTEITGVSFSHTAHAAILFQSLITAFIEILLLSIILIGLIFANPFVFLLILLMVFILSVGFFRPLSRRIAVTGRQARELDLKRSRYVYAMASSIRDIKIMGLEDVFSQRNRKLAMENAQLVSRYSFIATIQRLMVELILGCSIVAAAIWFAWSGSNLNQSAPTIVTLGLIAIRCAPSLSRLAGAYTGFRYYFPFVEGLLEIRNILANYPQKRELQTADFPGEYKAQGLNFSYGTNLVLHDCSITIGKGEVVAVVGPSGSGKSTLLDLLAGLQPPSKGNFTLGGKEFSPFLSSTFPQQVGYVPQAITLLDETLAFNIALEENPDPLRLEKAINRASLVQFVQGLPKGLNTLLGDGGQGLSGGQRQRLGIARALYRQPALLILDEVTSALDESTANEVMNELLGMRGVVSLLFVTHDLRWVQADRIYQLDRGSLSLRTI